MNKLIVNREGFWRELGHFNLPMPQPVEHWPDRVAFIGRLAIVETNLTPILMKGSSLCRVCNQENGIAEYQLHFRGATWAWPSGYLHYLKEHLVRPSLAFEEFINKYSE